jgi:hypothetical protein
LFVASVQKIVNEQRRGGGKMITKLLFIFIIFWVNKPAVLSPCGRSWARIMEDNSVTGCVKGPTEHGDGRAAQTLLSLYQNVL